MNIITKVILATSCALLLSGCRGESNQPQPAQQSQLPQPGDNIQGVITQLRQPLSVGGNDAISNYLFAIPTHFAHPPNAEFISVLTLKEVVRSSSYVFSYDQISLASKNRPDNSLKPVPITLYSDKSNITIYPLIVAPIEFEPGSDYHAKRVLVTPNDPDLEKLHYFTHAHLGQFLRISAGTNEVGRLFLNDAVSNEIEFNLKRPIPFSIFFTNKLETNLTQQQP